MARGKYKDTHALTALRGLVAFAESDGTGSPIRALAASRVLFRSGTWAALLALRHDELATLAGDLQMYLRVMIATHTGGTAMIESTIGSTPIEYVAATEYRVTAVPIFSTEKRRRDRSLIVAVDARPRDALRYAAATTLQAVGVERLQLCPAPDCHRVFVKIGRREYCSERCQRRVFASRYNPFGARRRGAPLSQQQQPPQQRKDRKHGRKTETARAR